MAEDTTIRIHKQLCHTRFIDVAQVYTTYVGLRAFNDKVSWLVGLSVGLLICATSQMQRDRSRWCSRRRELSPLLSLHRPSRASPP